MLRTSHHVLSRARSFSRHTIAFKLAAAFPRLFVLSSSALHQSYRDHSNSLPTVGLRRFTAATVMNQDNGFMLEVSYITPPDDCIDMAKLRRWTTVSTASDRHGCV